MGVGNGLSGRNLTGCYAYHSQLRNADLSNADLSGCNFAYADLDHVNLNGARLSSTSFVHANLRDAFLADWPGTITDADVEGAEMPASGAPRGQLETTQNWILTKSSSKNGSLPFDRTSKLKEKDLSGYDFFKLGSIHMRSADLKGWILRKAVFGHVDLEDANFSHADLRGADFPDANLNNANFEGADLRGADLSQAKGLTQWQLTSAFTDVRTKLPDGLQGNSAPIGSARK
jgi:uncharacterized protein YjbI with pentapeptide repeats